MHERYGYPYEMLAILLAVIDKKKMLLAAGITGISMLTYGHYLFETDYHILFLAIFNTVLYLWYLKDFFQDKDRFFENGTE